MSGFNELEQELEKAEETLAHADRAIQIARQEHERIAADLAIVEEAAEATPPATEDV